MTATLSPFFDSALTRRSGRRRTPPRPGRIAAPSARQRQPHFIGDTTPAAAVKMLRNAAWGDPIQREALFDDMIKNDGHLFAVSDSRRLALTGLPWEIVAAAESSQVPEDRQQQADEAVQFCRERLSRMTGLHESLAAMQQSVDRGLRIAEVEWDRVAGDLRPVAIHPLLPTQYAQDPQTPGRILVITDDAPAGTPLDEQPAWRFMHMARYVRGGNPFDAGLMLLALMWHMYSRWGMRWWGSGVERFGVPFLIARYLEGASADEKTDILDILANMGHDGVGIIRMGSEIDVVESKAGAFPHPELIALCNAEKSKLWLGATLTVEQGSVGSQALGREHTGVKTDRLEEDIILESEMMAQLIAPMVRLEFGADAWVPCFRRVIGEEKDLAVTSTWLGNVISATGVMPTVGWVVDEFGIEVPEGTDLTAAVPGGFGGGFGGGGLGAIPQSEAVAGRKQCGVIQPHRVLEQIAGRRRTAVSRIVAWVFTAVLASRAHTQTIADQISESIDSAATLSQALNRLPETFAGLPFDDMVELQRQFLLASQLAGRDFTRRQISARRATLSNRSVAGPELAAHADIGFDRLPFVAAIEALRDRIGLTPEAFLDLDTEARSRAWRVAGVWNMDLLAVIHTNLVQAINDGETSRGFRRRIPGILIGAGWLGENPWHADLVHYQNFAMAHAAGRMREYAAADITHWRFLANGDSCPICTPVIGRVFSTADRRFWPPLHFWCDCEDEVVFDQELRPGEQQDSSRIANPAFDEERAKRSAFRWDPAQFGALEPFRLSRFPAELRPVFEAFARRKGWMVVR